MRAVVQRVSRAGVEINGAATAAIGRGLVVLLGIRSGDTADDLLWLVDKIMHLRIFADAAGKMNISLADNRGEMLIVSQFTLYGDCSKGRRPGFSMAAPPEIAEPLYNQFVREVRQRGIGVATGTFAADMAVSLVNDGPVTLLLDSEKTFVTARA
ncbi:MAG: D-aminoacyl-tRNA deacylase [Desulforhopalus sp.]|nr:D-aminoacyl-tRNA deacylase [Desulforhopalus sp.]